MVLTLIVIQCVSCRMRSNNIRGVTSPEADTPDYPENAAYFVFPSTSSSIPIERILVQSADDLDAEETPHQINEIHRCIPDYADEPRNSSVQFEAGDPIPALFVDENLWRANHRRLVVLDADGQPIDAATEPSKKERVAQTAAAKLPDPEDTEDSPNDRDDRDGNRDDDGPSLNDVEPSDLDELGYQELRRLAAQSDTVNGVSPKVKIRAGLRRELTDRAEMNDDARDASTAVDVSGNENRGGGA